MSLVRVRLGSLGVALVLGALAAPAARAQSVAPASSQRAPDHTAADAQFMQGMIGHHSQAIVMCSMAPTHGASAQVSLFCDKVVRSQRDEIELMQQWLEDRHEPLTDAHAGMHMGMDMPMDTTGGSHEMLMPGMLTRAQIAQLDSARGAAWDRLLLTFMIRHHEGALAMVATLFDSPGSGQGPEIFGYATGVDADQRAEIGRMKQMLQAMGG